MAHGHIKIVVENLAHRFLYGSERSFTGWSPSSACRAQIVYDSYNWDICITSTTKRGHRLKPTTLLFLDLRFSSNKLSQVASRDIPCRHTYIVAR